MKPYHFNRTSQRALRSKKFNPDRKFQSWLETFNLDQTCQSRSKILIPEFLFAGPSWCTEKGSIENFNPRSIARNFQSRRLRSKFVNPRALWVWDHRKFPQSTVKFGAFRGKKGRPKRAIFGHKKFSSFSFSSCP